MSLRRRNACRNRDVALHTCLPYICPLETKRRPTDDNFGAAVVIFTGRA